MNSVLFKGALTVLVFSIMILWLLPGFLRAELFTENSASTTLEMRPLTRLITHDLFSLNVINLEWGAAWPTIRFKSWRNNHAFWEQLEPQMGKWKFDQLDNDVLLADRNGIEIMLLLGRTPTWASARPAESGCCGPNAPPGNRAEARDINDWRRYVRTVATRYKGRVHVYELWNEPDVGRFFSGTIDRLVELNKAAYEEVKGVDPAITVVSSAMSMPKKRQLEYFDRFLAKGGGHYADVIGFHFYVAPKAPESMLPGIQEVRRIMERHGVQKSIWNTETGWNMSNHDINENHEAWAGAPLSDSDAGAYLARSYILTWAAGVDRLYWYAWGHRSMGLTEWDAKTPKTVATAYTEIQDWLVGSTIRACQDNDDGIWFCDILFKDGRMAWIIWSPERNQKIILPTEYTVLQVRHLNGRRGTTPEGREIMVTPSPTLILPLSK